MFVGAPSLKQLLWGQKDDENLEELRQLTAALRLEAETAAEFHRLERAVRHNHKLELYDAVTGKSGPEPGDWVLWESLLSKTKMDPPYLGPAIVTHVEKDASGAPTGWVRIAEILAGLEPGDEGYPARAEKEVTMTLDRIIPFDHSRTTANEAFQWRLPEGWFAIREILEGPNEVGQFLVRWVHREEPSWMHAAPIDHSAAYQQYCKQNGLDRQMMLKDQRAKALQDLKNQGKAMSVISADMRETRAKMERTATAEPHREGTCPRCKKKVPFKRDGTVDGRHLKTCTGAGER
jgi:hypothetical protein